MSDSFKTKTSLTAGGTTPPISTVAAKSKFTEAFSSRLIICLARTRRKYRQPG